MAETALLFRDDAYARECDATVLDVTPEGGLVLDRTVFYAQGGGQPGDVGTIAAPDGTEVAVANTVYGADRTRIVHQVGAEAARFKAGDSVKLRLDWERRFPRM